MNYLLKASLWALAFVPLIVDTSVFFPYIYGKTLLIRLAIFIASAVFFGHFLARPAFRMQVSRRIKSAVKNPLAISVAVFMLMVLLSTIFAVHPFRAFFGDVERGEGFLGLFSFFAFFVYSYLSFDRKDWFWFFRLNILSGVILFIKELFEYFGGITRPGAYTGNAEFLAGYFLFVVFSSVLIYLHSTKKDLWKYVAPVAALMGVVGIFITQTRGTILALAASLLALVIYGVIYGKNKKIKGYTVRNISVGLLILGAVFLGVFVQTRENAFWQKVPGLARAAKISSTDPSTQTRLISLGVSLNAINPAKNGWDRLLIGYGPDNFNIAYNKEYNPQYFAYERVWFDRAHNKIMDMAVMHGLLGLLAYLALWGSFFYSVFRGKEFSRDKIALFLFGMAYFVHLLTVFDQISTYIPFFGALAFFVYTSFEKQEKKHEAEIHKNAGNAISFKENLMIVISGLAALWFLVVLYFWTAVPYFQMSNYLALISSGNPSIIMEKIDDVFEPYTFAQQDIRNHFLAMMIPNYAKNPSLAPLLDKAIIRMEEFMNKEPNARFLMMLGQAYDIKYSRTGDATNLEKAEENYRKALALVPQRQDVIHVFALNLGKQKKFEEAKKMLEESYKAIPIADTKYYLGVIKLMEGEKKYVEALNDMEEAFAKGLVPPAEMNGNYQRLAQYFYKIHDKVNYQRVVERLVKTDTANKVQFETLLNLLKKGEWPTVNFKL